MNQQKCFIFLILTETKLFADPDLSGAIDDGEGDDLFITGSRSEVQVKVAADEEDNGDLFRFVRSFSVS